MMIIGTSGSTSMRSPVKEKSGPRIFQIHVLVGYPGRENVERDDAIEIDILIGSLHHLRETAPPKTALTRRQTNSQFDIPSVSRPSYSGAHRGIPAFHTTSRVPLALFLPIAHAHPTPVVRHRQQIAKREENKKHGINTKVESVAVGALLHPSHRSSQSIKGAGWPAS